MRVRQGALVSLNNTQKSKKGDRAVYGIQLMRRG